MQKEGGGVATLIGTTGFPVNESKRGWLAGAELACDCGTNVGVDCRCGAGVGAAAAAAAAAIDAAAVEELMSSIVLEEAPSAMWSSAAMAPS